MEPIKNPSFTRRRITYTFGGATHEASTPGIFLLSLIVNFEGQVQRLRGAVHGRGHTEWKILVDLVASLGDGEPVEFVSFVRKAITESEAAFAGMDLVNVGAHGAQLSGEPVG